MCILKVENLYVNFFIHGSRIKAVDDVSFKLIRGETYSLVGESGAGKSSVAHAILKLYPPRIADYMGRVIFNGIDLLHTDESTLQKIRGNRISMVFQEPMSSLNPLHRIEKQIGEIIRIHTDISNEQVQERVMELLKTVRINNPEIKMKSYPHQLSGGEKQRVMIAMAIANKPDILIADEPTTSLDVTIQAAILDLLLELKERFGLTLLLITHDLSIVKRIANYVAVMKDGKIVESGDVQKIFESPEHEYTRYLISSIARKPFVAGVKKSVPVIEVRNLKVYYPILKGVFRRKQGYIKAVDGVNVTAMDGETVGLVGESGSGKTSTGLAILRLIKSTGSIVFMGREIQGLPVSKIRPLRSRMQIIFQDPYSSMNPRMTVEQIIAEGLKAHGMYRDAGEQRRVIEKVLEDVEIDPAMKNRYPHEFSGGQRQRINIARALVLKPKFIVLDEPTSSLDVSIEAQIVELLKRLQKIYGLTYLFISHNLRLIRSISDRVYVMYRGRIVEEGSVDRLFYSPKNNYTRELIKASLVFDL